MAQLSDDCFAFNGPLLPVADAERLIVERISPVSEYETVTLRDRKSTRLNSSHRR